MTSDTLPANVQAFISAHIDSVEAVNVLLLIFEQPTREWTADEVARELRTNEWSADMYLRVLRTRDLLQATNGSPTRFRAEPAFTDAVAQLARTFRERRVAVIRFIYSRPDSD
ncbi:MAG TPA: hypothetical protein VN947_11860 [Polyangia bacterium]|nr:hypothetical protein [Polyangia bacterium]